MRRLRLALISVFTVSCGLWVMAQQAPQRRRPQGRPRWARPAPAGARRGRGAGRGAAARPRKVVLAWADTRNGVSQHESVSRALAIVSELGYASGAWDTWIRTDSHIISKSPMRTDGTTPASGGPNLNNVDAIFFMGHREVPLDAKQKEDLLSFVRDDGKGFVAAHVGLTALESWPEFGELIGGRFDNHPVVGAGRSSSRTHVPGHAALPRRRFDFNDEFYQPKEFSRDKIHVLLRLDTTKVPANVALDQQGRRPPVGVGQDVRQGPSVLRFVRPHATRPGTLPM